MTFRDTFTDGMNPSKTQVTLQGIIALAHCITTLVTINADINWLTIDGFNL